MLGTLCHVGEDGCAACCADQHGREQHLFYHPGDVNEADLVFCSLFVNLSFPFQSSALF